MAKKNLHPQCYLTPIFYGGIQILKILTTKQELHVDIWAGNHPFYTKSKKFIDTEGRVQKFEKKYKFND